MFSVVGLFFLWHIFILLLSHSSICDKAAFLSYLCFTSSEPSSCTMLDIKHCLILPMLTRTSWWKLWSIFIRDRLIRLWPQQKLVHLNISSLHDCFLSLVLLPISRFWSISKHVRTVKCDENSSSFLSCYSLMIPVLNRFQVKINESEGPQCIANDVIGSIFHYKLCTWEFSKRLLDLYILQCFFINVYLVVLLDMCLCFSPDNLFASSRLWVSVERSIKLSYKSRWSHET